PPSPEARLELESLQDFVPAVLTVEDRLDVELLPPDVERLVEAFLKPRAHEELRPLRHVPARAHEVDGIAPVLHAQPAEPDGAEVDGHEGGVAELEGVDGDDPELARADHGEAAHGHD